MNTSNENSRQEESGNADGKNEDSELLPTAIRRQLVIEGYRRGWSYRNIAESIQEEFGAEKLPKGWDSRYVYKDVERWLEKNNQQMTKLLDREARCRLPKLELLEEKLRKMMEETEDPHAMAKLADSYREVIDDQVKTIQAIDNQIPTDNDDGEERNLETGLNLRERKQARRLIREYLPEIAPDTGTWFEVLEGDDPKSNGSESDDSESGSDDPEADENG